jgi:DNA polymerase (family 10)
LVDVIAHPTGRIIGEREEYPVDAARLIEAAARTGVALELNASPHRLDLPPRLIRQAAAAGVAIAVSTDAHDHRNLADLEIGVRAARRGWLTPERALNSLPLDGLVSWRRERLRRWAGWMRRL